MAAGWLKIAFECRVASSRDDESPIPSQRRIQPWRTCESRRSQGLPRPAWMEQAMEGFMGFEHGE